MSISKHLASITHTAVGLVWTYDVSDDTNSLGTRSRPVARHDALHADLLRSAEDFPLLADNTGVHGADEDVDALEVPLQLLVVIGQVPDADFDPGSLESLDDRLRHRRRADENCNTLFMPYGVPR